MAIIAKTRRLTKTLRRLGANLRVAVMVAAMAFAAVGLTYQPCQCGTCDCDQDARSCCCCSETPNSCCGCGCQDSDNGCSCSFCMCSFQIDVEPSSLPRINDSVNPMVFATAISLTSPKPYTTALFRPDRTAVTPQTHLHALYCRWQI